MKREHWLACALSAVLSFCICFAGVMCLQSAFALEGNRAHIALGCAAGAVIFSLGFTLKWWYVSLVPILSAAGLLWYQGRLAASVRWLLYRVSSIYDLGYHCGVLCGGENAPETGDATLALCLIGCLVCFVCSWVICRRKPAIFAVLAGLLPLAACFAVIDTVPEIAYLFLLLAGLSVLVISQLTRNKDRRQGNRLTLLVIVPVVLAMAVLFWAVPRDTYRGQDRVERLVQRVQSWFEGKADQGPIGTSTAVKESVELDRMGRLTQTRTPVMTVSADSHSSATQDLTGTFYLRQQGFQTYSGTSWSNEGGNDIYEWIQWEQLQKSADVTITTRNQHFMKFVPYYAKHLIHTAEGFYTAEDVTVNFMGFTENLEKEYGYTFYVYQLKENAATTAVASEEGYRVELPVGSYLPDAVSLPAETASWAEDVVAPLIADQHTVKDRAEAIGTYVSNLARYDRNTTRMAAGETDFAWWFVTEAETGYCVHYATTAAVLLRAAGIHAQYVEGYVVRLPQDGTAVTVYEDQAHAWVEYYDPAVGWRILECTPPEGVPTYIQAGQNQLPTEPQDPLQPPEQTGPEQQPQQEQTKTAWKGWYWILALVTAAAAIFAQWRLRLLLRRRRLTKGGANQRAVQLWLEVARCSRRLKKRPAPELCALAQKAKFSQHKLSAEELAKLTRALADCHRTLRAKPWYLQPVYTLILAIY